MYLFIQLIMILTFFKEHNVNTEKSVHQQLEYVIYLRSNVFPGKYSFVYQRILMKYGSSIDLYVARESAVPMFLFDRND